MKKIFAIAVFLIFTCQLCAKDDIVMAGLQSEAFSACSTSHYKIVHDVNSSEANEIANLLEYAYANFNTLYVSKGFNLSLPEDKLTWFCFANPQSFIAYSQAADKMSIGWLTSYYSAKTNAVSIIKPAGLQTWNASRLLASRTPGSEVYIMPGDNYGNEVVRIMHEAAHQLAFNTGLQKQKVMYPIWVSEGLASNFESVVPCGQDNLRQSRLLDMYRTDRLIPMDQFILMTYMPENSDERKDVYAEAWGFYKFLYENYCENLKAYLSAVYELPPRWRSRAALHTEFITAFGSLNDLNTAWLKYLNNMPTQK